MSFIAILGRERDISLAELELVFGADNIKPFGKSACLVNTDKFDISDLGGTIKVGQVLEELEAKDLNSALPHIKEQAKKYSENIDGKMQLGLSVYGQKVKPFNVQKAGLEIKKNLRAEDVSVRLIPNKYQDLNAAQVIRNKLTHENGFEVLVVFSGNKAVTARCIGVQDIDSYAMRDREKPVRDSFVGMLPPKLAQTMLNLACVNENSCVLDPFCGTGTVLMEASLKGAQIYGSDLSEDMINASHENVKWLFEDVLRKPAPNVDEIIAQGDARGQNWPTGVSAVVCETYLGPPLKSSPSDEELAKITSEVKELHLDFLENITPQVKSGTTFCLAVPIWLVGNKTISLNLVDYLEKLGYNRLSFQHVSNDLHYYRPSANVGRELIIMTRK